MKSAHLNDGLPEILAGLVYLFYCAMSWSSHLAQHGSATAKTAVLIFVLLAAVTGLAMVPAARWLRLRYLTARSGYVKFKPRTWRASAMITAAVLAGTVFALAALGLSGVLAQHWLLMITGVLIGSVWALLGRRPRFFVTGGLIVLSAVLLGFSTLPTEIAWCAFYACAGVLTLASGTVVLLSLIRRTAESPE
jgi:hypothetical protein